MLVRKQYGSEELDEIFIFFMKTALRFEDSGIERVVVDAELPEPVKGYLNTAVELMLDGQPFEISDVILQTEFEYISRKNELTKQQLLELLLIRDISEHMHFDSSRFDYLLSTGNLWQDRANEYAVKTLYCNLPEDIKKLGGYDRLIQNLPEEILEPDNF